IRAETPRSGYSVRCFAASGPAATMMSRPSSVSSRSLTVPRRCSGALEWLFWLSANWNGTTSYALSRKAVTRPARYSLVNAMRLPLYAISPRGRSCLRQRVAPAWRAALNSTGVSMVVGTAHRLRYGSGMSDEGGSQLWRVQVLPLGKIDYRDRELDFTSEYLADLIRAFDEGAFDVVPFVIADSANSHTSNPALWRGGGG